MTFLKSCASVQKVSIGYFLSKVSSGPSFLETFPVKEDGNLSTFKGKAGVKVRGRLGGGLATGRTDEVDLQSSVFKGDSKSCEEEERRKLVPSSLSWGLLIGIPFRGILNKIGVKKFAKLI